MHAENFRARKNKLWCEKNIQINFHSRESGNLFAVCGVRKNTTSVIPAQAGIQKVNFGESGKLQNKTGILDSRLRGNDGGVSAETEKRQKKPPPAPAAGLRPAQNPASPKNPASQKSGLAGKWKNAKRGDFYPAAFFGKIVFAP